ncbi:MAG: acyltransferase [Muribaculaceae bacterium]|nr:acyltransferase [Muribaculaceae bacterium]
MPDAVLTPRMAREARFPVLDSLRGLFAVAIVLLHYHHPEFLTTSRLAVCFFFMASGFLLEWRHGADTPGMSWRAFTLPRVAFLYLIHWFALLLLVVPHHGEFMASRASFWPHVLLLQSWCSDMDAVFAYNDVAWFLSALVPCYLLYVPLSRLLARTGSRVWLAVLAVAMVALGVVLWHLDEVARRYCYVLPALRVLDFALGMALARLVPQLCARAQGLGVSARTLVDVLLLAVCLFLLVTSDTVAALKPFSDVLVWWVPTALVLAAIAVFNARGGALGRVLAWRPLVWLGTVSMEVYLFQHVAGGIVNYGLNPLLAHFGLRPPHIGAYLTLLVLLPLAWLLHRYVSRPLRRWLLRARHSSTES